MSVSFEEPTLCFLIEEIGGRGELRIRADLPSEGEYFGTGHLTLLAAEAPIILHSSTLRQAQFACLPLRPRDATCLTTEQAELIMRAPGRLMFHHTRLHTCAMMLSAYEGEDEHDAYGLGLRHALLAALVGVANEPMPRSKIRLTGRQLARVLDHINEHLDERPTNDSAYPIPAVWIGRLATSVSARGQGLGELLLQNALKRILQARTTQGVHAAIVEAKDPATERFYRKYGFRLCDAQSRQLYLPLGAE